MLAVLIAAVVYVLPTVRPGLWPRKKINLGLDLQGGMHLVLEVETEKAVESRIEHIAQELRAQMRQEKIAHQSVERVQGTRIAVQLSGAENREKFRRLLDKDFKELRLLDEKSENDLFSVKLDLPNREANQIQKSATEQAIETIRNRVDQFGVSEPDIRQQGDRRILIQLPGITDTQRAKDLIGRTALLEFRLVEENGDMSAALRGEVPRGSELLYEVREDRETRRSTKTPLLIKKEAPLTGASLTDARMQIDSKFSEPYVSIKFDGKGARVFERITGENVKRRLAIVLDRTVYSAPVIQEKIGGGEARITGSFTAEEARDLAIVLRAGALPAPVKILEERTVGPSLGSDSIHKGLLSIIAGGLAVLLFMAVYYKLSGLMADLGQLVNLLIIAAGLAAFGATLTLPGIAGVILTIGMGVDANVLIYERIREELRLGKSPRAAVDAGFDRATLTILDSNITTLIAAVVLFQFGTGPVKGFAVTLSLGILASMFTALILCREIFEYVLRGRRIATLSI